MTNISHKEETVRDNLINDTHWGGNPTSGKPTRDDVYYAQFLTLSRLADAAERLASALESLNTRDRERFYKSDD